MQIYTIASGSSGNCTLVKDGDTAVLIDAGISTKRIVAALRELDMFPEQLNGILITHEHGDHVSGLNTFIKHYDIPIFAPRTVANHLSWSIAGVDDYLTVLLPGQDYDIKGLTVLPFHTPHDTPESVGYRLTGSAAFGFCTDFGHVTDEILESLRGVDTAVIEANHDIEMLKNGPYPFPLKRRILSDNGHLSNDSCGLLAKELYKNGTRKLVLGHLSRENNLPSIARKSVLGLLSAEGIDTENELVLEIAPENAILSLSVKDEALC
ncbi:MAG: MBL fold metallo-hydrolase [Oscillospiraceae bacterium]|nr:MBL fold metallo-hydrolase [Oscillospiraceae bacterium]